MPGLHSSISHAWCPACGATCRPRPLASKLSWRANTHLERPRLTTFAAKAATDSVIEDLPQLCDEFQCNSSPSVESTIRSFARNVENRTTWTVAIFAREVQYKVRHQSAHGNTEHLRDGRDARALGTPTLSHV